MAITFTSVPTYLVFVYGGPTGNNGVSASINLGIANALAFLNFYPEGTALPANSRATRADGSPIFYVSYRQEQFHSILDLLRNETPVSFFFRDDTLAAYITTANEPVGEGER